MNKPERIKCIKEIMYEKKQIDVSALSVMLEVTEATIRNDLEQLEGEGFLTRYHGGASLNTDDSSERQFQNAGSPITIPYDREKEKLAEAAAAMVQEREWIFLGPGTTCYYIAKALSQRKNLNIMTNSFFVVNILGANPYIRLLFLGGNVQSEGMYSIPDNMEESLKRIYLNKAFFSVDAVSLDSGYTLTDIYILDIIKMVCSCSGKSIMCADSKKFGQRSFMYLADLDFTTSIVSDRHLPPEYEAYYRKHGVEICTAV